jgi:hypothetical protein
MLHDILSTMPRNHVFQIFLSCPQEFDELTVLSGGAGILNALNPACSQALTDHLQKNSSGSSMAPTMSKPAAESGKNVAPPLMSGALWAVVVAVTLFGELGG